MRYIRDTNAIHGSIEDMDDAVEYKLPFHLYGELLAILFELPSVDRAGWPVPDIDASMFCQIMR